MGRRLPKPKVGGSTPLGTAMNSNKNFRFVARANLTLFANYASGATRGYKRRRSGAGSTVPSVRAGDGQRPGLEGADRGGIRRRHHVGDRLRHGHGAAAGCDRPSKVAAFE